jgi:hypothetical protein
MRVMTNRFALLDSDQVRYWLLAIFGPFALGCATAAPDNHLYGEDRAMFGADLSTQRGCRDAIRIEETCLSG